MGSADAVPGISGGTIALVVGIYERLIAAVTSFNHGNAIRLLRNLRKFDPDRLREITVEMDVPFLVTLLAGILTAVVAVLRLMHFLLQNYAVLTFGFFFGLIAVSAVVLYAHVEMDRVSSWVSGLAGFLLSFTVSGVAAGSAGHGSVILFVAGMVAVSAMVLPGISGSLMLVILGQYDYMSAAVSGLLKSLVSYGGVTKLLGAAEPVILFGAGGIAGLLTVAHAVDYVLENHREVGMAFLVSLVLGALRAPVIETTETLNARGMTWSAGLPFFLLAAVIGGAAVYVLDRKTEEFMP